MSRLARTAELMRMAPHVYGAALAASRDERAAAGVTEGVLAKAAAEPVVDRDQLIERALLLGVRSDPAASFRGMDPVDREAVALARLAGYSTAQIAASLGMRADAVKASLLRALRGAAARAAS